MPQIQGVQGRSRSILLRVLGNAGDGASSAFPPSKKHDIFLFAWDAIKNLFGKQVQKYSIALLLLFFLYFVMFFMQLQG